MVTINEKYEIVVSKMISISSDIEVKFPTLVWYFLCVKIDLMSLVCVCEVL